MIYDFSARINNRQPKDAATFFKLFIIVSRFGGVRASKRRRINKIYLLRGGRATRIPAFLRHKVKKLTMDASMKDGKSGKRAAFFFRGTHTPPKGECPVLAVGLFAASYRI